jgi:GNAT superfamily N-acetyltransferase
MAATESLLTSADSITRPQTPGIQVIKTRDLSPRLQTELLAFAVGSTRIDGQCIGWLPTAAYVGAHEQGRIVACYNNSDLVGYILWGANNGIIRCFIVWVRRDARLLVHGKALVSAIRDEGLRRSCTRIELWCAIDLAANLFWAALGFERICWRWGRAKKARRHWLWRLRITSLEQSPRPTERGQRFALAPPNLSATQLLQLAEG